MENQEENGMSLEEKQKTSQKLIAHLSQDVDALRDTILKLSERLETLKTPSPASKSRTLPSSTDPVSPVMTIEVESPFLLTDGFGSHNVFRIVTKTKLAEFGKAELTVVCRRYDEIEWLHAELASRYPDVPVVELSRKQSVDDVRAFMLFLSKHKILRVSDCVRTFLLSCPETGGIPVSMPALGDPFLNITVGAPVTLVDAFGSYSAYMVIFDTNLPSYSFQSKHSRRRRFREFEWLVHQISVRFPGLQLPELPEKKYFGRLAADVVHERQQALQRLMTQLAHDPVAMFSEPLLSFCTADVELRDIGFGFWSQTATQGVSRTIGSRSSVVSPGSPDSVSSSTSVAIPDGRVPSLAPVAAIGSVSTTAESSSPRPARAKSAKQSSLPSDTSSPGYASFPGAESGAGDEADTTAVTAESGPGRLVVTLSEPELTTGLLGPYHLYTLVVDSSYPRYRMPREPVKRRFRDFETLCTLLSDRYPDELMLPLPPKQMFKRFSDEFLADRKHGLEAWLRYLASNGCFVSSPELQRFCTLPGDWQTAPNPSDRPVTVAQASTAYMLPQHVVPSTMQAVMQSVAKWWPRSLS